MKNIYPIKQKNLKQLSLICFFVLAIFLFSAKSVFSQDDKISSLIHKAETSEIMADKVQAYCDLAWEFKESDLDRSYEYGKKAYDWAGDLEINSNTANLYINISYIFIVTKNDFDRAMKCLKKANKIADNSNDDREAKRLSAKIQEGIGMINFKVKEYEIAIESYEYAANLYLQLSMGYNASNCYHILAQIYEKKGDKRKADLYSHRETANNKRLELKAARKPSLMPANEDQMVKIEDMSDAFE